MQFKKILILGGPTASGKSSLALEWACEHDGEIINADSMQIYKNFNVLTACPSLDEMDLVPHHLYRLLKGDDPCSAERWRDLARDVIDDVWSRGKLPIVVGGTGLYLKTLVYGLSKIPKINEEIRYNIRKKVTEDGAEASHEILKKIDPEMALRLPPGDGQRISRALEVFLSTKKSLSDWQLQPLTGGLIDEDIEIGKYLLLRDRSELYARCDQRFNEMMEQGAAIEEVRTLMSLGYSQDLPMMKSLGVPQIINYLQGNVSLEETITLSKIATRKLAKRQMTWLRNQFSNWKVKNL